MPSPVTHLGAAVALGHVGPRRRRRAGGAVAVTVGVVRAVVLGAAPQALERRHEDAALVAARALARTGRRSDSGRQCTAADK